MICAFSALRDAGIAAHRGFLKKARNNRDQDSREKLELYISETIFLPYSEWLVYSRRR